MKQLFLNQGSIVHKEFSLPLQSENALLVEVAYSCISSGTEGATLAQSQVSLIKRLITRAPQYAEKIKRSLQENGFRGTYELGKASLSTHMSLGYSCSGRVIAVGEKVRHFSVGDYVACGGAGFASHAEYIAVPSMLAVRLNSSSFLKEASLTTIGSIALQGVRQAQLHLGDTVCVIGLGLLGILTVQLLKHSGCRVIGIDVNQERLDEAAQWCDLTFHAHDSSILDSIYFFTNHYGVDATIITASSSSGEILQQATEYTRRKGKVILVGDVKIDFNRSPFYEKELTFSISCSYGPGRYDRSYELEGHDYPYAYVRWTEQRNMNYIASLLEKKELNVDSLLACEFEFEKAREAYVYLQTTKPLAIVLSYSQKQGLNVSQKIEQSYVAYTPKKSLKAGVVGCGGFSKVKLLPILNNNSAITLVACADSDPAVALSCAKHYAVEQCARSHEELVSNNNLDIVVVATPHAFHTAQALDFLQAGKAVFCEKPAATSWDDYDRLKTFLTEHPDCIFTIDFNRSYAPYIQSIASVVSKRSTPLIMSYRMNAGFLPQSHWVQAESHGGRIIGEGCHIIDLFLFLVQSCPTKLSVQALRTAQEDLSPHDNCLISLSFEDGSLCSLLYTSVGNKGCSKERLELFCEGKTIIMDDYSTLTSYGFDALKNQTTRTIQKGHEELLGHFIETAQGKKDIPISYERILMVTKVCLMIRDLIHEGGGSIDIV